MCVHCDQHKFQCDLCHCVLRAELLPLMLFTSILLERKKHSSSSSVHACAAGRPHSSGVDRPTQKGKTFRRAHYPLAPHIFVLHTVLSAVQRGKTLRRCRSWMSAKLEYSLTHPGNDSKLCYQQILYNIIIYYLELNLIHNCW